MSIFDPNTFLDTVYRGEVDYKYHTCPAGEYVGQIPADGLKLREVQFKKIEGRGVSLDIQWNILDDEVKKEMNMDNPQARQSFLLDLTPDGNIDWATNRNMKLKYIRKATGLDTAAKFQLAMLRNQAAWVKVDHVMATDSEGRTITDDDGNPQVFAEVVRVSHLEKGQQANRQTRQAAE